MATALQLALLEPDAGRAAIPTAQLELQRSLREEKAGHGCTRLALAEAQQARYAAEAAALRAEQRADALAEEAWQLREQLERAARRICSDAGPAADLQLREEEAERRAAECQQNIEAQKAAALQAEQRAEALVEQVRQLQEQLSMMQERSQADAALRAELQRKTAEAERRAAEFCQSAEAAQRARAEAVTTVEQLRQQVAQLKEQNTAALEEAAAQVQQLEQTVGNECRKVTTLTRQRREALAKARNDASRIADLEQQLTAAKERCEDQEQRVAGLQLELKQAMEHGEDLEQRLKASEEQAEEDEEEEEEEGKSAACAMRAGLGEAAALEALQCEYEAEQRAVGAEVRAEEAEHAAEQRLLEAEAERAETRQKLEAAELVEAGPMLAVLRQLLSAMEPGPASGAQVGLEAAQPGRAGENRPGSTGRESQEAERAAKQRPVEAEPDPRQRQLGEAGLVEAGVVVDVLQRVLSSSAGAPGCRQVEARRPGGAAGECGAGAESTAGPGELAAPQHAVGTVAARGPAIKQEPVDGPGPSPSHRRKQDRPHRRRPEGGTTGDQSLSSEGPGAAPLSEEGAEEPAAKRARL